MRKDPVESEACSRALAEHLQKPGFCSFTFRLFCKAKPTTSAFWGIPCVADVKWQRSSGCNYVLSNRMAPQGGKNPPKIINSIFGRVSQCREQNTVCIGFTGAVGRWAWCRPAALGPLKNLVFELLCHLQSTLRRCLLGWALVSTNHGALLRV